MNDAGNNDIGSSTVQSPRRPLAVRLSAIIAQVLALAAALSAFDLVLAAVDSGLRTGWGRLQRFCD